MNDGTIITDKIISAAKAEADEIMEKANKSADEIIKKAEKTALSLTEKSKADAEAETEKIRSKELSSAHMAAKKKALTEKQTIIDGIIAEAYKRLTHLPDEEYEKAVLSMLKDIPKEGNEIIVSQKDNPVLGDTIKSAGYTLAEETRDLDGGFIVKNGDIELNFSFGSILSVEQEEIRQMLAGMLFK